MTFNPTQPRESDGRFGTVHRGDPGQLAALADEPLDERERYMLLAGRLFDSHSAPFGADSRTSAVLRAAADYDDGTMSLAEEFADAERERLSSGWCSLPVARSTSFPGPGDWEFTAVRTWATGNSECPFVSVERRYWASPTVDDEVVDVDPYECDAAGRVSTVAVTRWHRDIDGEDVVAEDAVAFSELSEWVDFDDALAEAAELADEDTFFGVDPPLTPTNGRTTP